MKTKGKIARMRRFADLNKTEPTHKHGDLLKLDITVASHTKKNVQVGTVDKRKGSIPVPLTVDGVSSQRALGGRDVLDSGKNVAVQEGTGLRSIGLHAYPVKEFGPYENRKDARGGYFAVDEWEFYWFEDDAAKGRRPSYLKTREEALRAAIAAARAMRAGGKPC